MRRYFHLFLTLFFCLSLAAVHAQDESKFSKEDYSERFIEELAFEILNAENDEKRVMGNQQLIETLEEELNKEGAFSYPFTAVKSLGILTSPDSMIRIFNWNIPLDDGTYAYGAFVLKAEEDGEYKLIQLHAIDTDTIDLDAFIGNKNHWPSALYYELIQKKAYNRTYYFLLAWDGHNRLTNRKWIDVFWFNKEGELQVGAPIFKNKNNPGIHRVVFRYASQNKMGLSYRKDLDRIEFDHLSPPRSSLKGIYEYYGADFSHDAYYWKGNYWEYKPTIDIEEGIKKRKKDFIIEEGVIKEQQPIYEPN